MLFKEQEKTKEHFQKKKKIKGDEEHQVIPN